MFLAERISIFLQSCILSMMLLQFRYPSFGSIKESGNLTISVERMVSDYYGYDLTAPNLFLEVEAGGQTRFTLGNNSGREVIVRQELNFDNVSHTGALMFRLRDGAHRHRPCRGLLALTLADVTFARFIAYKMDALNWIVMSIDWK